MITLNTVHIRDAAWGCLTRPEVKREFVWAR
jgi:hypothetical protein